MLSYDTYKQIESLAHTDKRKCIRELYERFKLDYRTAVGLTRLFVLQQLELEHVQNFIVPEYYTIERVQELAKDKNLEYLIPINFYENDEFLEKTGITTIPAYFAVGCQSIRKFEISKHITEIKEDAFYSCGNLREVVARPRKTELKIGKKAFYDCIRLKKLNINASIEIGESAFLNCLSLQSIEAEIKTLDNNGFDGCVMIGKLEMPKVKKIGKKAFHDCIRLESVYVPKVKQIEEYAFQNCYSLEDVTFESIEEINEGAFYGAGIVKIKLNGIQQIDEMAFSECEYLETIKIQTIKLSDVKENAFKGCKALTTLIINGEKYDTKEDTCYEIIKNIDK